MDFKRTSLSTCLILLLLFLIKVGIHHSLQTSDLTEDGEEYELNEDGTYGPDHLKTPPQKRYHADGTPFRRRGYKDSVSKNFGTKKGKFQVEGDRVPASVAGIEYDSGDSSDSSMPEDDTSYESSNVNYKEGRTAGAVTAAAPLLPIAERTHSRGGRNPSSNPSYPSNPHSSSTGGGSGSGGSMGGGGGGGPILIGGGGLPYYPPTKNDSDDGKNDDNDDGSMTGGSSGGGSTSGGSSSGGSSSPTPTITNNKPDGSYLSQPLITLTATESASISYCIGTALSGTCCDLSLGGTYSVPFNPGTVDGNYCVSAKAYTSSKSSALYTWRYQVDANLVSLTLDLPETRTYQTQQLFETMTIESDNFGDANYSFLQRSTASDPGAEACDALDTTTDADNMGTSLGMDIVNFAGVTAPFQVPLEMSNNIHYGVNYLISALERVTASGTDYKCFKTKITVTDFALEDSMGSASQALPTDGTYNFQGSLTTFGSLSATGDAPGADGMMLEQGFLNIIN